MMQSVYLSMARAVLDLGPNSAKSIETLRPATRFEFGSDAGFQPIYVRGLVYLRGKARKQPRSFRRSWIIAAGARWCRNMRWRIWGWRAPTHGKETLRRRARRQDSFALWKGADTDIPVLKEAKAEYGKLQ